MPFLTDRQARALAGLFVTRGKRKGLKRKTKQPFGTDAYIAGEAMVLVYNPYRMPSEFVLVFSEEQNDFFHEMIAQLDMVKSAKLESQISSEVKAAFEEMHP